MVGIHQLILADGLLNNPRCNEERDENLNRRGVEEEGEWTIPLKELALGTNSLKHASQL